MADPAPKQWCAQQKHLQPSSQFPVPSSQPASLSSCFLFRSQRTIMSSCPASHYSWSSNYLLAKAGWPLWVLICWGVDFLRSHSRFIQHVAGVWWVSIIPSHWHPSSIIHHLLSTYCVFWGYRDEREALLISLSNSNLLGAWHVLGPSKGLLMRSKQKGL